jgi:hypothetical protein
MNPDAYPYFPNVPQELLNKLIERMTHDDVLKNVHLDIKLSNGSYYPASLTWKGGKPLDPSVNRCFESLCEELGIHIGPKFTAP